MARLRKRLAHLAESLRYEEAARLRDRIEALEHVVDRLSRLERLRRLEICVLAPAAEHGSQAFFVCGGRISAARLPSPPTRAEIADALGRTRSTSGQPGDTLTPEQAEDLLLVDGFVRRPTPELAVLPLEVERIAAHLSGRRH